MSLWHPDSRCFTISPSYPCIFQSSYFFMFCIIFGVCLIREKSSYAASTCFHWGSFHWLILCCHLCGEFTKLLHSMQVFVLFFIFWWLYLLCSCWICYYFSREIRWSMFDALIVFWKSSIIYLCCLFLGGGGGSSCASTLNLYQEFRIMFPFAFISHA